jgi:hypothetical protein
VKYAGTHAPCGTVVSDELPDGYPIDEGVGLWCPACRVSFWHVEPAAVAVAAPALAPPPPEPRKAARQPGAPSREQAPTPEPAQAREPEPEPEPEPALAPTGDLPPRPKTPSTAPSQRDQPPLPPRRRPPARIRVGPVIALITVPVALALVLVALLTGAGNDPDGTVAASPTPTASATPTATPPPGAPPAPRITRRLGSTPVTLLQPEGWRVRREFPRLLATGPGPAQVNISVAPREGRSLGELARDALAGLRPRRPGKVRRTRLGGRPAVRVTAAGQEVVILVTGSRRWVVARAVADGGAAVARSVRIG